MKKTFILLFVIFTAQFFAQDDPRLTEVWSPIPPVIKPGDNGRPPSDAIILFDGKNLNEWTNDKGAAAGWTVHNGIVTVKPGSGYIFTKRQFADCQLHIEWKTPSEIKGEGQGRGNSGVFLQNRYELQVLDSYNNPTYSNGQAGSIYKQSIPIVNVSRKPGEWQSYDIIYTAPRFNVDSTLKSPAYITVLQNGVLIQNHFEIKGSTQYIGRPKYEKHPFKQSLSLQDHGNPVSFRNIWIRELNTQRLFNGSDLKGWYTYLDTLGKNNDPDKIFTVKNGIICITGKKMGYLCTEKSYSNYYLKAEFKWGDKRYPPREKDKRDSGILYNFSAANPDKVWPASFECQVQEGDCGDYWCVGTNIDSPNKTVFEWGMKRILRTQNFENSKGEWNTIEIICHDGQSEHYVNGRLVNWGKNASVSEGKILLQSEGSDVFFRNIEIAVF
ncbi:MAG: DUF1080 domain-containing protein [Ignavibacteriaceae bacterium]